MGIKIAQKVANVIQNFCTQKETVKNSIYFL